MMSYDHNERAARPMIDQKPRIALIHEQENKPKGEHMMIKTSMKMDYNTRELEEHNTT